MIITPGWPAKSGRKRPTSTPGLWGFRLLMTSGLKIGKLSIDAVHPRP
jgi:hypothetical protein